MTKETRIYKISDKDYEFRVLTENGKQYIQGYFIVFNQRSHLLFENKRLFHEIIKPEAMTGVLENPDLDVLATYMHNTDVPMARLQPSTNKNSLELRVDEKGLFARFEVINTNLARDCAELLSRNIISECSFIFTSDETKERWYKDEQGYDVREINQFLNIYDITLCVNGAYHHTFSEVVKRNLENKAEPESQEEIKRKAEDEKYLTETEIFILENSVD